MRTQDTQDDPPVPPPAGERKDRRSVFQALPPLAWALLVLVAGLLLTAELARRDLRDSRQRADMLYNSLADAAQVRLDDALDTAAVALRAMQTVLLSAGDLDQTTYAHYHDNLRAVDDLPGYLATAFARRHAVTAADGTPLYRYELLAPLEGNEMLLWLDITTQPDNLAALERARDADRPSMSAPFQLTQFRDAGDAGLGITLRLPVYSRGRAPETVDARRARETGVLAMSLRLEPLVRTALQGRILEYMHVALRDTGAADNGHVFASGPLPVEAGAPAYTRMLEFGDPRWELRMQPLQAPADGDRSQSIILLGTLISVLAALLLWSIAGTHRRALALGQRMSARVSESEARFRTLNELLPALVLLADADGTITYANQFARRRLGDVVGTRLDALYSDPGPRMAVADASGREAGWEEREMEITTGKGSFWARVSLAPVVVDGQPHMLLTATDISEQRELNARLRYQASHDALTELCNRREFERQLALALAGRRAHPETPPFALLYFDVDQFKLVNDLSGHRAGDQMLVEMVLAIGQNLREGDLFARLGGDEFGLLAYGVNETEALALAERLRRCIDSVRFVWQGRTHSVSASIGVVMSDRAGATLQDVMAWADSACYQAKENGRNRVHLYREDDDSTRRHSEMEWASRMRSAIEQGRLLLDYQEVVPLTTAAADGPHIELLLRLRDENGAVVLPGAFMPAAERYGLMPTVDRWVIGTVLGNFARLHPAGAQLQTCAINLSGASIDDEDLAAFILDCIARHKVPAQRVCFEITETVAVRSLLRVTRVIERLRTAGCRIALDDFGSGMSSFGYLKNLPVDVIKIDGSFIREVDTDPMSRTIVSAIVQIGHQRGLKVVAEWVDNDGARGVLDELGVDYGQGFALHEPERVMFQR
ncbi:bifunctional diguanylate cyclase/phosphodiesterase [Luteimonas sp. MHLX1A]|uniref:bifunctional diguanylate cyclase/phosphodiesterase n=1 Tax=Alterluteimonas muca TaxID=2878684 RepID=UPI001E288A25|nr:EAL domain-containing protein [Luteimonas sp. MHLX1A]MCD9047277.1 EAL domain-containing protein [Luteimonas sp. MHLX1A]